MFLCAAFLPLPFFASSLAAEKAEAIMKEWYIAVRACAQCCTVKSTPAPLLSVSRIPVPVLLPAPWVACHFKAYQNIQPPLPPHMGKSSFCQLTVVPETGVSQLTLKHRNWGSYLLLF